MRLVQLVEDVLELARADAARGNLHVEPTDLREEIDTAIEAFSPTFDQKSVVVKPTSRIGP